MTLLLLLIPTPSEENNKLEQLYYRYRHKMKEIACSYLGNEHDAEDAIQSTFEKLARCTPRIPAPESGDAAAFISVVLKNTCKDLLRKKKYRAYVPLDDIKNTITVEPHYFKEQAITNIFEAIQQLPKNDQEILMLKYYYDLSIQQLAVCMNLPYMTTAKRLTRARKKLQTLLEREELSTYESI